MRFKITKFQFIEVFDPSKPPDLFCWYRYLGMVDLKVGSWRHASVQIIVPGISFEQFLTPAVSYEDAASGKLDNEFVGSNMVLISGTVSPKPHPFLHKTPPYILTLS